MNLHKFAVYNTSTQDIVMTCIAYAKVHSILISISLPGIPEPGDNIAMQESVHKQWLRIPKPDLHQSFTCLLHLLSALHLHHGL